MRKILFLLTAVVAIYSCNSDDDFGGSSTLGSVPFAVNLKYDTETFNGEAVSQGEVVLKNTNTGDTYTLQTNATGVANFVDILPGTYDVTATKTLTSAEFTTVFGYAPTTESVTFNGSQGQVLVNANVSATTIQLKSARIGDLVIKQIYYAGSHTTQGAVFRDQFIEIYNNSNEVIYADGLYIAQLYGRTSTTAASFTLSSGQFDWSQSTGMTSGSSANTNFVYSDYVFRIPGNGTQHPIEPGKSIVLAQTAVNHKAPMTDNSGLPVNIVNPDLTVDLSSADFEAYLGNFRVSLGEDVYRYDIQNPAVPDMEIAYWGRTGFPNNNKDMILDNLGRDSFVIFRADNFASFPNFTDPSVSTVVPTTTYFVQIPNSTIIDGVDLQHFNPSSQRPKMLPSEIDASFINTDAAYNSQAVIRKTKATIDGRVILEDTNNSANDFIKRKAEPRGFQN